jgi:hypothetical protein
VLLADCWHTNVVPCLQAEAIHKAQCLVLFEGLAVDLANGLDAVNALESEMQHLLMQVRVRALLTAA